MALLKSFKIKRFPLFYETVRNNYYVKYFADKEVQKCYNTLGIAKDCDQDAIRTAYLELVKKYHPDSGGAEADSDKFHEIDQAFRILQDQKTKERLTPEKTENKTPVQEFDINHTAPQHRQYLSYGGIGMGNPSQRQKQYGKMRAMHAAENLLNHRMNKSVAIENALFDKQSQKHKIKTKHGYDRLVEDLIQEGMSRGDFDNLSGKGRPLKNNQSTNPYVDFTTHKLNQVLIDNGFTPEWIMLQKEIRSEREQIQQMLYVDRTKLGNLPFDEDDQLTWSKIPEQYENIVKLLNQKIKKYNLVVPMIQKQMFLFNIGREAEKIAKTGQSKYDTGQFEIKVQKETQESRQNIFSFIGSFFSKEK